MLSVLLDSNIILYAVASGNESALQWIEREVPAASAVSYVETLGYHRLNERDRLELVAFFVETVLLPLDERVIGQATVLRQERRMSLGDAIIAATALVHDLTLVTRNVDDFRWIADLRLLNPFEAPTP